MIENYKTATGLEAAPDVARGGRRFENRETESVMTEREKQEYELALKIGNARYGSPCEHSVVRNGHCANCGRKVR